MFHFGGGEAKMTEVQVSKAYETIASHYLEKRLSEKKFSTLINSIDDISISFNGKDVVEIKGAGGNLRATKVENKIKWEYIKQEKKGEKKDGKDS